MRQFDLSGWRGDGVVVSVSVTDRLTDSAVRVLDVAETPAQDSTAAPVVTADPASECRTVGVDPNGTHGCASWVTPATIPPARMAAATDATG